MAKRVLITGGAGFIGSALSGHLQEAGHEVFVLDDLSFGKRHLAGVDDAHFFHQDIRDRAGTLRVFATVKPDQVLHLAAVHFIPYCNAHPVEAADININGTIHVLDAAEAKDPDGLKEQFVLRYMLDVETRGSQSLLNVQAFADPTAYTLKVKRRGSDESREMNVDLLETFNWLIGITVKHIAAPQTFSASFERDSEGRLRLKGRLKQDADGAYWFRTVTGTTPDGRRTLVIWRKLTGNPEEDNLVLDELFTRQGYSSKDSEFDLIYVNGGNNLENLKTPDDLWKVRLIEEDFHRLMFEVEGT